MAVAGFRNVKSIKITCESERVERFIPSREVVFANHIRHFCMHSKTQTRTVYLKPTFFISETSSKSLSV